jgi:hypothetical protein
MTTFVSPIWFPFGRAATRACGAARACGASAPNRLPDVGRSAPADARLSFEGFVGPGDSEHSVLALRLLADLLHAGQADGLIVPRLTLDLPMHSAARSEVPWVRGGYLPVATGCCKLALTESTGADFAARSIKAGSAVAQRLRKKHGEAEIIRGVESVLDLD